jgi:hypothetical protein
VPPRDLRASDADRERVVTLLSEAAADGRLTAQEHAERVESAYSARTLGELTVLTRDLLPPEAQPIKVDARSVGVAFGTTRRDGRWVVPVRLPVLAVFGTVELDLREAILQRRHVVIDASMLFGSLRLLVPDGFDVTVTGKTVLTARDLRVHPEAAGAMLEVTGTIVCGSVRAQAPRRTLRRRIGDRVRRGRFRGL